MRVQAVAPPKPVEQPMPPSPTPVAGSYGADKITVLEGLEPVRKRCVCVFIACMVPCG